MFRQPEDGSTPVRAISAQTFEDRRPVMQRRVQYMDVGLFICKQFTVQPDELRHPAGSSVNLDCSWIR